MKMDKNGMVIYSKKDKIDRYLRMFRHRIYKMIYPNIEFRNIDNRHKSDIILNFPKKDKIWIATKLDYAIVLDLKKKEFYYHEYGE